jgi:hypothetical protein
MRLALLLCAPIALSSIFSTTATAEVVESGAMTMKIKEVIELAAPVDKAYASFLKIGSWWDKEHTFSGDAANLSLDARPGGCFCEKLPNGGGVLHLTVVFIAPNQRVTLSGALGPLQTTGVTGAMSFSFVPKPSQSQPGSQVVLVYNVGGYYPNGLQSIAPNVDEVLSQQMQRLKNLVETGSPANVAAAPAAPTNK